MKISDIKINEYYMIRKYTKRPRGWNDLGKMDHFMGKTVKIKTKSAMCIYIYDKEGCDWAFTPSNFVSRMITTADMIPDHLFEI